MKKERGYFKVVVGPEKKSRVMSGKKELAYHEAGAIAVGLHPTNKVDSVNHPV